jgi:hypothetical protein
MAPIMAKMSSAKAQELTAKMAEVDPQSAAAPAAATPADPNALPQIVGK